jgi:hypothetical protein
MSSPLSFIERGGVPPKTIPVADLVVNPQRAYAADAPSNADLINIRDDIPFTMSVEKQMNDNLSMKEKGRDTEIRMEPIADRTINP